MPASSPGKSRIRRLTKAIDSMRDFAMRKLREGRMNENYAAVYQEFMREPANTEEAQVIASRMFTYRLYTDDPKVRSVIIRHRQMKQEEIYPCVHGIAYPRIYTEDAAVIFQDEKQRRYASTVDYNMTPLFDDRKWYRQYWKRAQMKQVCCFIIARHRIFAAQIWGFFRSWSFHLRLQENTEMLFENGSWNITGIMYRRRSGCLPGNDGLSGICYGR